MARIMAFGCTQEQIEMIEHAELSVDIYDTDCFSDLLALPSDLAIINPDALKPDEAQTLTAFYREIEQSTDKVIIAGQSPLFEGISFVTVIPDFFDEGYNRTIVMMRLLKENKRDVDISRRVTNTIKILKLIEENPGITTKMIADKTELSERSVKRYIRSMQAACVFIEYRDKGWRCVMDPREIV